MAGVVLILGLVCCCSSSVLTALAFPIPALNPIDKVYDGFTEIASGRVVLDRDGKAFTSGLEEVCAENCAADFTCNSFCTWTHGGQTWCLKTAQKINPWITFPEFFVNKTASKIYIKNS
jgi:hypothetical protein